MLVANANEVQADNVDEETPFLSMTDQQKGAKLYMYLSTFEEVNHSSKKSLTYLSYNQ